MQNCNVTTELCKIMHAIRIQGLLCYFRAFGPIGLAMLGILSVRVGLGFRV